MPRPVARIGMKRGAFFLYGAVNRPLQTFDDSRGIDRYREFSIPRYEGRCVI